MATTSTPGTLGTKPVAALGSVDSDIFAPRNTDNVVSFWTRASVPGTVQPFRLDKSGAEHSLGTPVAVAASPDEDGAVFFMGLGAAFMRFTSTAGAGIVNFEVRVSRT